MGCGGRGGAGPRHKLTGKPGGGGRLPSGAAAVHRAAFHTRHLPYAPSQNPTNQKPLFRVVGMLT